MCGGGLLREGMILQETALFWTYGSFKGSRVLGTAWSGGSFLQSVMIFTYPHNACSRKGFSMGSANTISHVF